MDNSCGVLSEKRNLLVVIAYWQMAFENYHLTELRNAQLCVYNRKFWVVPGSSTSFRRVLFLSDEKNRTDQVSDGFAEICLGS